MGLQYPTRIEPRRRAARLAVAASSLKKILLDFNGEGDALCVTRLDRLARLLADLIDIGRQIEAKGAALKVLLQPIDTSSPTGRPFFAILAAIGQFETELHRERQLEGISRAKREGKYRGGKVRFNPNEIRTLHKTGTGPAQIARQLGCSESSVYRALRSHGKDMNHEIQRNAG